MIESKAWDWVKNDDEGWRQVSEEFLPVALRWKTEGRRRILDLGCGLGRNALWLAREGFEVSGFDLSEDGLAEVKRQAEELGLSVALRRGDMLELPYPDASFDGLLAFHVIYHTDLDGLRKVLGEIRRVLVRGGEAYLTLNSRESDAYKDPSWVRINEYTLIKTQGPEIDIPHTYIDYEDLEGLLKDFEVLRIRQIFDYHDGRQYSHYFVELKKRSVVPMTDPSTRRW